MIKGWDFEKVLKLLRHLKQKKKVFADFGTFNWDINFVLKSVPF